MCSVSTDDVKTAIEEAEKAAKSLKDELSRARELAYEALDRLRRHLGAGRLPLDVADPVTGGGTPETANDR